jgi:hypothetical protein
MILVPMQAEAFQTRIPAPDALAELLPMLETTARRHSEPVPIKCGQAVALDCGIIDGLRNLFLIGLDPIGLHATYQVSQTRQAVR